MRSREDGKAGTHTIMEEGETDEILQTKQILPCSFSSSGFAFKVPILITFAATLKAFPVIF